MSRKDKVVSLVKRLLRHPSKIVTAVGYVVRKDWIGLRKRMAREARVAQKLEQQKKAPKAVMESLSGSSAKFLIVLDLFDLNSWKCSRTIRSIAKQDYSAWTVLLIHRDTHNSTKIERLVSPLPSSKVEIASAGKAEEIPALIGKCKIQYDYMLIVAHCEVFADTALYTFASTALDRNADLLYSDHFRRNALGFKTGYRLKPDWSPDLFYSDMYLGSIVAIKKQLLVEVGGIESAFYEREVFNTVLKAIRSRKTIVHIDLPLYAIPNAKKGEGTLADNSNVSESYAFLINEHFMLAQPEERGIVGDSGNSNFFRDIRYAIPDGTTVSIIIPTKDHVNDLKRAIDSILRTTKYPFYEILIMNNNSEEADTAHYLEELQRANHNIRVEEANYPFNWSKINNHGISLSQSDVFIFLNNDVLIETEDWLERLVENAIRDSIGIVGCLLLYPTGKIQHAGVVVGMMGWAEHIYKNEDPSFRNSPFISPLIPRNISAVTGACMAISRNTINTIGSFDENFIVCGSDVEICLRAIENGLNNLYLPQVKLIHFESATRDTSIIPQEDFIQSEAAYRRLVQVGDPFFNNNLDYRRYTPRLAKRTKGRYADDFVEYQTDSQEVLSITFRKITRNKPRLNLLIPSISQQDIFGGISTALHIFNGLLERLECDARIILFNNQPIPAEIDEYFSGYSLTSFEEEASGKQIVSFVNESEIELSCSNEDIFIFTIWWTALSFQESFAKLGSNPDVKPASCIYLIQDYEPGFYPWSTKFLLAEATYKSELSQIAVFNSGELKTFFERHGYQFAQSIVFEPALNTTLKEELLNRYAFGLTKKKQILVYGRPSTDRNAFDLLVESLKRWAESNSDASTWTVVSAGEEHENIYLGNGAYLLSVGKVTLEGYAQLLADSFAGVSLMVSPHPSYPPLEMAAFGVKVITNSFENKNIEYYDKNIYSIDDAKPTSIAKQLSKITSLYERTAEGANVTSIIPSYLDNKSLSECIIELTRLIEIDLGLYDG